MPVELTSDQRAEGYTDAILPAPDGWEWQNRPVYYGPRDVDRGLLRRTSARRTLHTLAPDMERLIAWAKEYDIYLEVGRVGNCDGYQVPDIMSVNPSLEFYWSTSGATPFRDFDCPYGCGATCTAGMEKCANTECGLPLVCVNCRHAFGMSTFILITHQDVPSLGCGGCIRTCRLPECQNTIPRIWRHCREHGDHFECEPCGTAYEISQTPSRTIAGVTYCASCSSRVCMECGHSGDDLREEFDPRTDTTERICQPCYEVKNANRIESKEVSSMTPEEWLFTAMPDRPYRLVSVEQEFEAASPATGGWRRDSLCGNLVARKLNELGLAPYAELTGYHSGAHRQFVHVETDASVTSGGEIIINRARLDTPNDVQNMIMTQEVVRELVDTDQIRFTARCGTHVHVDLHDYTIPDARAMVTCYSYIEDVVYRLGSAGFGDHREVLVAGGYSLPIRKDKWGDIVHFGREFLRNADHTDSLNMMHFYASMKFCKCGAIEFGNMAECTCVRKKCTVEWRVFNGTGDPRKLHAYIAIASAVTAWAKNRDINPDDFPPLEFRADLDFTGTRTFRHLKHMDEWIERLEWMFTNLPFSAAERESIMYTIERSPIRYIGEDELNRLRAIERVVEPGRVITHEIRAARNMTQPDRFVNGICTSCAEPRPYCGCDHLDEPYDPSEEGY